MAEEQAPVNSEEQSSVPQSDDASVDQTEDNGLNDGAPQSQAENTSTESAQASKPKPPASGRHDTTITPGFAVWLFPIWEKYLTTASRRKIFIGGIGPEIVEADLKEYFGGMGEITDVVVMKGTHAVVMASVYAAEVLA